MNREGLEGAPEAEFGERSMEISGKRITEVLGTLENLGLSAEGKDIQAIEDAAFSAARKAAKAENRQEEAKLSEEVEAWRSLLPFVRPNNSITGVERDENGAPVGLDVVIKELPRE